MDWDWAQRVIVWSVAAPVYWAVDALNGDSFYQEELIRLRNHQRANVQLGQQYEDRLRTRFLDRFWTVAGDNLYQELTDKTLGLCEVDFDRELFHCNPHAYYREKNPMMAWAMLGGSVALFGFLKGGRVPYVMANVCIAADPLVLHRTNRQRNL